MPKASDQSTSQSVSQGINLSTLRRKRGNIVGHITTFSKILEHARVSEQRDIGLLRARLTNLHEIWERFDAIQLELEEADEEESPRRFHIHGDYISVVARANALIEGDRPRLTPQRITSDSPAPSVTAPMAIKLPEMRLPQFDGKIEKWASYFESFSSMIDQHADLTPVQKLQYLRSTLSGKAAACIESLGMTDADYTAAIELLKEKFDCKRRILLKHCNAIIELPKITRDSPEALGDLVDTVRQNLRSLKNLDVNTSSWDSILMAIILTKLSADTVYQWELTLKNKQMPTFASLLEFLDKRANCVLTTHQRSEHSDGQHNRGPPGKSTAKKSSRSNAFVTATRANDTQRPRESTKASGTSANFPRCPICDEEHGIWRCEKFHALSAGARLSAVKKASLCVNCLRAEHNLDLCKKGSCRICRKHHHTLLHLPTQVANRTTSTPPTKPSTSADMQVDTGE
ncbi:uncharacterized protein LOC114882061 [Osmia bicornis bicornis]|uniref:uncharacterized protein LOC114882061 n=1 Tax=Osmia bicornis bicornis TaxID=1437191 RepID=UPI0010F4764F|nr:uncharacterized protein LOC114882061 [Osmia bicornis bicornis]